MVKMRRGVFSEYPPTGEAGVYRALEKFRRQNNAGAKVKEYPERHGYGGVHGEGVS